ncbi:MAG: hypothetical protein PHX38_03950 [Sulfuricella sp.]|nr:hypothetical protein [Sulfuricella sp.]
MSRKLEIAILAKTLKNLEQNEVSHQKLQFTKVELGTQPSHGGRYIAAPTLGEGKKGDLADVFVYKLLAAE